MAQPPCSYSLRGGEGRAAGNLRRLDPPCVAKDILRFLAYFDSLRPDRTVRGVERFQYYNQLTSPLAV